MQSDFISLLDAPVTLVPLRARDGTIRAFAQIGAALRNRFGGPKRAKGTQNGTRKDG